MFRRPIALFSSRCAVALAPLALAACTIADFRGGRYGRNPRVAERPLSAANDSGVAFAHDVRFRQVVLRDAAGVVTDVERVDFDPEKPTDMRRGTHWDHSRDLSPDEQVVTVLTLPPGDYEVVRVLVFPGGDPTAYVVGGELPFRFRVEPHRVAVLGRVFCHSSGSDCEPGLDRSPGARARVVDLLAHPLSADERALWSSWHTAAAYELTVPPPSDPQVR